MAGKKDNCEAGAHLISREGRPEDQVSISEQLDRIQEEREAVRETAGRKPVRAKRDDIAIAKTQDRPNTHSRPIPREQFELLIENKKSIIVTSKTRKWLRDKIA